MTVRSSFWLLVGGGTGYVLGSRAGRQRYDHMLGWVRRNAQQFGVTPVAETVAAAARRAAADQRDDAAAQSEAVLLSGAATVAGMAGRNQEG